MKNAASAIMAVLMLPALAGTNTFERYEVILERQMFGPTPPGFDPTKPPAEAVRAEQPRDLTREQEMIKRAIRFSMINVTPDGVTTVGFSDNSDQKHPIPYYLKVGEEKDGWKVVDADPVKATMKVAKDGVEVDLELGASAGRGPGQVPGQQQGPDARGPGGRTLMGGGNFQRRGGGPNGQGQNAQGQNQNAGRGGGGDSMRRRRETAAAEREAAAAKERAEREAAAKEKAQRDAKLEEQRQELQLLRDEFKAQREAIEKERAERAARELESQQQGQGRNFGPILP